LCDARPFALRNRVSYRGRLIGDLDIAKKPLRSDIERGRTGSGLGSSRRKPLNR
jgi:hypothetical protein